MEQPRKRVRLTDQKSIEDAKAILRLYGQVEIQLAPDFHHVLYAKIYPESDERRTELLQAQGGIELLEKVSRIRGLGQLGELLETVRASNAHVEVLSPVPLVVLWLSEKP